MMLKAKVVTARAVSRALKAAGHERSKTYTTSRREWIMATAGFEVEQCGDFVLVYYHHGDFSVRTSGDHELRNYANSLREKGYGVDEIRSGYDKHLKFLRVFKEA